MTMTTSVLLIEDDPDISDIVAIYLRREQYTVDTVTTAEAALAQFARHPYDLIISDIMLPGMDGIQLAELLRHRTNVPIIFLTSKKTSQDIVVGLNAGGDDYVTKPFEPEVLIARVRAALRRTHSKERLAAASPQQVWSDGRLYVHKERLEVTIDGLPVKLPTKELQLLLFLLEHPKQVLSVDQLYERIWSLNGTSEERTVMVHIHNLRKKIERDAAQPEYIVTVRGFGYKFGVEM